MIYMNAIGPRKKRLQVSSTDKRIPSMIEVLIVYGFTLAYIVRSGKLFILSEPHWINILFPLVLGAIPVLFAKFRGMTLSAVFPFAPVSRSYSVRALLLVPAVLVVLLPLSRILLPLLPASEKGLQPSLDLVFSNGYLYAFLSIVLLPAISEEILCRGFILSGLRSILGKWESIIVCAALFAVLHLQLIRIPFAFVPGVAISYIAWESRSLVLPIAMHFLHNGILFCILLAVYSSPTNQAMPFVSIFFP